MESFNKLACLLILFYMLPSCKCATIAQSEDDRDFRTEYTRQREELLNQSNYDPKVRPSRSTNVTIQLHLHSLNELDIGSQTLSTTIYFHITWYDGRLTWVPPITEIECIAFTIHEVWTPYLSVRNNKYEKGLLGIYEDGPIPLRVCNNGTVEWIFRVTPITTCQADITHYPYDTQVCPLEVGEWNHPLDEVDLVPLEFVTDSFTTDEEWDLIPPVSLSRKTIHGIGGLTFRRIEYYLEFKRNPNWYIPLLIIPVGVLFILLPCVFCLPSLEKQLNYLLTILLSFTVYFTFVSSRVPSVSSSTCNFSVFLAGVMVLGGVFTLLTLVRIRHETKIRDRCPERQMSNTENTPLHLVNHGYQGDGERS
ncbi:neuronal acetylcholine receptor subunit beta-4-like [Haliotis rufescens]|uniref:neuronal acetylcholine receptor subunit beta-4-like n=1 Tax=Haliotis rufescens TaxID=6454 RepID=UPI00201EEBE5|nr:neuronal acetylcholine receptor subunit beta-4-like [Haliotis rufescens]